MAAFRCSGGRNNSCSLTGEAAQCYRIDRIARSSACSATSLLARIGHAHLPAYTDLASYLDAPSVLNDKKNSPKTICSFQQFFCSRFCLNFFIHEVPLMVPTGILLCHFVFHFFFFCFFFFFFASSFSSSSSSSAFLYSLLEPLRFQSHQS